MTTQAILSTLNRTAPPGTHYATEDENTIIRSDRPDIKLQLKGNRLSIMGDRGKGYNLAKLNAQGIHNRITIAAQAHTLRAQRTAARASSGPATSRDTLLKTLTKHGHQVEQIGTKGLKIEAGGLQFLVKVDTKGTAQVSTTSQQEMSVNSLVHLVDSLV